MGPQQADVAGSGGPSQAMVFTGQKIWQVETNVLMMPLVGTLEPNYEIPLLMLAGVLIGLPLLFAVMRRGVIQERKNSQLLGAKSLTAFPPPARLARRISEYLRENITPSAPLWRAAAVEA